MLTKSRLQLSLQWSSLFISVCSSLKADAMIGAAETKDGSCSVAQERGLHYRNWLAFYAQSQGFLFGLIQRGC